MIPSLKGKDVSTIRIQVARQEPDLTKKYKFYEVPTRWVHELYPIDEIFARDLGIAEDAFHLELVEPGASKDVYTLEALDANGRVVQKAHVQPEDRRARVSRQVPGLVAGHGHDWMDLRVRQWHAGRRCAHRHRSRALLGSLSGEGAAEDVRPRDEGDGQPSAARQAAVPSRSRRRSLDVRTRLPDWRRRGTDLVARIAARGSLLRHARFLRRARPHDRQAADRRPGQDLSDHPSRARRQARTGAHPLRGQRLDEAEARALLQGKGSGEAGQDDARDREDRDDGVDVWQRGRCGRRRERERWGGAGRAGRAERHVGERPRCCRASCARWSRRTRSRSSSCRST